MKIVVRNNISSKLKNSTSEIGYYSYTNRWHSLQKDQETMTKKINENIINLKGYPVIDKYKKLKK